MKELGKQCIGILSQPLLFFASVSQDDQPAEGVDAAMAAAQAAVQSSTADDADVGVKHSVKHCQHSGELASLLLDAVLSFCPSAIDAVMHAVAWGDPHRLKKELLSHRSVLTRGHRAMAFQQALLGAVRHRDQTGGSSQLLLLC